MNDYNNDSEDLDRSRMKRVQEGDCYKWAPDTTDVDVKDFNSTLAAFNSIN